MNLNIHRFCSIIVLSFMIFFISAPCGAAMKGKSKDSTIYIVGEHGYIEKYDSNWNLLATARVDRLVGPANVRDADVSPDGSLLFLAVSKTDSPLIIINTKDLSVDTGRKITFPLHAFATYFPLSLIAVTSRYLYMADESFTGLPDPFMNILIDINNGTATRLPSSISLNKEDVVISPHRDVLVSRHFDQFKFIDVPTGRMVDSIDIQPEFRGRKFTPFDVDWTNKKITAYKVKSDNGKAVSKLHTDMPRRESIKQKDEKINIPDKILTVRSIPDSTQYLIEDDKGNFHFLDKTTNKVLDSVGQNITASMKGRDMRAYLSPNNDQLIYLKGDSEEGTSKHYDVRPGERHFFSRLDAIHLKTKKIIKNIEFPENIVAVLFAKSAP